MSENENCIFDTLFSAKCTAERRKKYPATCNACGHNPNNSSAQSKKDVVTSSRLGFEVNEIE